MSISVVIPTYNRASLIKHTLDAILDQETPASEIIVIDDGSTDATSEVLQTYHHQIRTLRVANGGDLAARNIGVRSAAGRLIAFCDSDDLWRPGFLTAMTDLWNHQPDLTAAYGNFQTIRNDVWERGTKFDDAPPGFWTDLRSVGPDAGIFDDPIVPRLLRFQPFFPSAMVVDRVRFLDQGGWDEAVSRIVGTDFATTLRLAERPVGVVWLPLVGIRRHDNNYSGDTQAMNLGDARILEHALATRPALTPYRSIILASIADRRAAAADIAFDRRDFTSVLDIQRLLPSSHRPLRRRVKGLISSLPAPVAHAAASLTGRLDR